MRTILLQRQGGNGRLIWSKLLAVLILFMVLSRVECFLALARILLVYPSSRMMMLQSPTQFRLTLVAANDDDAELQCNNINNNNRGSSAVDNLAHQFINRTLPKEEWTHEAHLQVGLWHVLHYHDGESSSTAAAAPPPPTTTTTVLEMLRERIQRYNMATGGANTNSSGYHETLTQFYVSQIAHFVKVNMKKAAAYDDDDVVPNKNDIGHDLNENDEPEIVSRRLDDLADELIAQYGERQLPLQYWSRETLFSIKARQHWMEPDLKELPFDLQW